MANWPEQKGDVLIQVRADRDSSETIEALRIMLRAARAASARRLDRATQAGEAVRRLERTFRSHQKVIRRQGEYIERMKLTIEIATDAVHADGDVQRDALLDLSKSLADLERFRSQMKGR